MLDSGVSHSMKMCPPGKSCTAVTTTSLSGHAVTALGRRGQRSPAPTARAPDVVGVDVAAGVVVVSGRRRCRSWHGRRRRGRGRCRRDCRHRRVTGSFGGGAVGAARRGRWLLAIAITTNVAPAAGARAARMNPPLALGPYRASLFSIPCNAEARVTDRADGPRGAGPLHVCHVTGKGRRRKGGGRQSPTFGSFGPVSNVSVRNVTTRLVHSSGATSSPSVCPAFSTVHVSTRWGAPTRRRRRRGPHRARRRR